MSELPLRLVTHKNCLDGSMSAIVFEAYFGKQEVLFVNPNEVDDVKDRELYKTYFVDVCPSTSLEHEVILDHHFSSEQKLKNCNCKDFILDFNRCGCRILFEHLHDERCEFFGPGLEKNYLLNEIVLTVDDYDRYVLNEKESSDLAVIHESYEQQDFIDAVLDNYTILSSEKNYENFHWKDLIGKGAWDNLSSIKKKDDIYVANALKRSWLSSFVHNGKTIEVANVFAEKCTNELADALLDHYKVNFCAIVNFDKMKISFRSNSEEINCADIANELSSGIGGGHKRAAAMPIDDELVKMFKSVLG